AASADGGEGSTLPGGAFTNTALAAEIAGNALACCRSSEALQEAALCFSRAACASVSNKLFWYEALSSFPPVLPSASSFAASASTAATCRRKADREHRLARWQLQTPGRRTQLRGL